jgi:hypothetical protein
MAIVKTIACEAPAHAKCVKTYVVRSFSLAFQRNDYSWRRCLQWTEGRMDSSIATFLERLVDCDLSQEQ